MNLFLSSAGTLDKSINSSIDFSTLMLNSLVAASSILILFCCAKSCSIVTRDQRDLVKIYKAFYLKYPHLKWVSFRDMRGLPREQKNIHHQRRKTW